MARPQGEELRGGRPVSARAEGARIPRPAGDGAIPFLGLAQRRGWPIRFDTPLTPMPARPTTCCPARTVVWCTADRETEPRQEATGRHPGAKGSTEE